MTESSRRGLLLIGSALLAIAGLAVLRVGGGLGPILAGTGLAAVGVLSFLSALGKKFTDRNELPNSAEVSTPSKIRIKPIVKLREEIVGMIESHKSNPVVSAMAFDTRLEIDSIVLRAVEILEAKRRVQKLAAQVFPSRAAVKSLEDKLGWATGAAKDSVGQALQTRKAELQILEELETETARLDANLDEAEAALAELRSRLLKVVATSSEQLAAEEMDPLSGMTERLHRISTTMEESVGLVSTRIGNE
jgi:hypothetical protein